MGAVISCSINYSDVKKKNSISYFYFKISQIKKIMQTKLKALPCLERIDQAEYKYIPEKWIKLYQKSRKKDGKA